jgi:hypothetical protein
MQADDDIRMSNDELMLMISSLELVATILPEAGVQHSELLLERMAAVKRLTLRLNRIAFKRGLRAISIASTNF